MPVSASFNDPIVIAGAGFAGAATAYFLAQRGHRNVIVCEQEEVPDRHSSGRSAAMTRALEDDPVVGALAIGGSQFIEHPPKDWDGPPLLERTGGLLLADGDKWSELEREAIAARARGVSIEEWSADQVRERIAALAGAPDMRGMYCPGDGMVDITALLQGYLAGARNGGVDIRFECPVERVVQTDGRVTGVIAGGEELPATVVVNATGAWAQAFADTAGARAIRMRPMRRHIHHMRPVPWDPKPWPWVWDVTHGYYFRAESGGLIVSACDETEQPPGVPVMDPQQEEVLAETILARAPALAEAPLAGGWAGLRTFANDRRPVVGWDPELPGLFWVAALGGFGVTVSATVGERAAQLIGGAAPVPADAHASPDRAALSGPLL